MGLDKSLQQEHREKLAHKRAEIQRLLTRKHSHDMAKLSRKGVKTEVLTQGLALILVRRPWPRDLRRRMRNWRSLAARLRKIVNEIKVIYADPSIETNNFRLSFGAKSGAIIPDFATIEPPGNVDEILHIAQDLEHRADETGTMLRRIAAALKREPLTQVLAYLYTASGRRTPPYQMLAAILDELGVRAVSDKALERMFERHVKPRLKR